MAKKHVEKMSTELAGLYAVASELCKEGYLVTVVPFGRYPAIDLIIHDMKEDRFTGIQVKTLKNVAIEWYFKPSRVQPTVFVKLGKETLFHVLDRKSVAQVTNEAPEQWIHKENIERSDTKDNWDNIWK